MAGDRHVHGPAAALAAVGAVAAALALGAGATGSLDRLEAQSVDARFGLRAARPAPDLAIIDLDGESINRLGAWPIPRRRHARAIDLLRRAGARVIAYDVQFTEPGPDPAGDVALVRAIGRARGTVLSTTEVAADGDTAVLGGQRTLDRLGARAANTSVPVGLGGVVRRVPHALDGLESFAVAAAETATGRDVAAEGFGAGGALIDFRGPPGTIPTYRFADLLAERVDPAALRGRIVVVGSSAPSLQDLHPTPMSSGSLMPGAEVQANAISTVLRGLPLRDAPAWLGVLATLALALVLPLAATRLRPLWVAVTGAVCLAAWAGACALFFDAGVVLPAVAPLVALALGAVGTLAALALRSARDRRRVRSLFGRFVPDTVVDELLERGDGTGGIGGVRQDATVLFCDLRGFTTFAEGAEPELVIDVLNTYLAEMTEAIHGHGGTVVSYLGDGIMAVFGAPVARSDHARIGLAAAVELVEHRLGRLNGWLADRDLPPFALGVGLNSGAVMSGTVGSERRMEYAAVGDTTNVAARLQAATKATPHALFVSRTTWERLPPGSRAGLVSAGRLPVRGREAAVPVWSLPPSVLDERDEADSADPLAA